MELNDHFTDSNIELLLCVACLSPCDSFAMFDKIKLIRLAGFYPKDFNSFQLTILHDQLDTYIVDMRSKDEFGSLDGIGDLARAMVKTRRNKVYPLVYLLLTLALVLPVTTASVERAFLAMNIIKTRLRNRMGDEWLSDILVTYIERNF